MAAKFREVQQGRNKIEPNIARLNDAEVAMFEFALNAYVENNAPLDQAMESFEKSIKEFRQEVKVA